METMEAIETTMEVQTMATMEIMVTMETMAIMVIMAIILTSMLHQKLPQLVDQMAQMVMAQMEMDQNVFVMGLTMEMVMETMTTTETMATMAIILTFMLHQKLQHLVEMTMDPTVIEMDPTQILMGQMVLEMEPIVIAMDLMDLKDQMDPAAQTEMDPVDFVRRSHVKSVSQ